MVWRRLDLDWIDFGENHVLLYFAKMLSRRGDYSPNPTCTGHKFTQLSPKYIDLVNVDCGNVCWFSHAVRQSHGKDYEAGTIGYRPDYSK